MSGKQAEAVVKYAKAEADAKVKEGVNNDNKYGVWFKMNHQPWCMMFVQWCFSAAKCKDLILRTAGCEAFEAWAKKNDLIISTRNVEAGDVVLFDFHKEGKSVHVGIAVGPQDPVSKLVPTVEGNTSADGSNESNGDGVYYKHRKQQVIRAVVRPKWGE